MENLNLTKALETQVVISRLSLTLITTKILNQMQGSQTASQT